MKSLLPFLFALALVAGCAFNRPSIRETSTATNGVVTTRETRALSFAWWPATTTIDRQKLSLGKTQSIGTEGLEAQSGATTNDVQVLNGIRAILGR